jgi:hypothetical protein
MCARRRCRAPTYDMYEVPALIKFRRSSLAMIAGALGMVTEVAGGPGTFQRRRTGTLDRLATERHGVSEGRLTAVATRTTCRPDHWQAIEVATTLRR